MEVAHPAVPNEDENKTAATTAATTTTTSGSKSSVKKTTVKTEEKITIPTTTTKVKVDTTKMKDLCKSLEVTLGQMVDETREDDLFITRLQEEFLTADEKWENKVTAISNEFLDMKKDLVDDKTKKEVDGLKAEIEELRQKVTESERENHQLQFDLKTKGEEIERLTREIERLREQMENEAAWRDKVQSQLEEIQAVKENTNKERLDTMTKVSDEIIRFRNKRVPDPGELKDLHEVVDRIHHSMGYLMVLGQQPPITNDNVLNAQPTATVAKTETTQASSTKKKNKVSLKAKRESMKAAETAQPAQLEAPVSNGKPAEDSAV